MTPEGYIASIESAIRYSRRYYFPNDRDERRQRLLALAREIGHGLSAWDDSEIKRELNSTYSRIVARNALDSTGVVLDNREWIAAILQGVAEARTTHHERAHAGAGYAGSENDGQATELDT